MTANGEVQSREEATIHVKELDVYQPLDQRSKTTFHQKRKRIDCKKIKLCVIRGSSQEAYGIFASAFAQF